MALSTAEPALPDRVTEREGVVKMANWTKR